MGLKLKVKFKKFKKSVKKHVKKVGKVIKKISKITGMDKVFNAIGKGIKSAFTKFGKFMNKIGVVGQIAMMFILPGIGSALMSGLASFGTAAAASTNFLVKGLGHLAQYAHTAVSTVGNVFSNVTKGVMDTLGNFGKTLGKKMGFNTTGADTFFGAGDSAFSRSFTNSDVSRFQNLTLGEEAYQEKLLGGMEKINQEALKSAVTDVSNVIPDGVANAADSGIGLTDAQLTEFNASAVDSGLTASGPQMSSIAPAPQVTLDPSLSSSQMSMVDPSQLVDPNAILSTPVDTRSLLQKATDGTVDYAKGLYDAGKEKVMSGVDVATDPEKLIDLGVEKGSDALDVSGKTYLTVRAKEEAYKAAYDGEIDPRTPIYNVDNTSYRTYIPEFTTAEQGSVGSGYADTTNAYESLAYSNSQYGNTAVQMDYGYSSYMNKASSNSQFNPSNWGS
jgi:hypothetical protein